MLRRLTLGLFTIACAAAVAACSSGNTTVPSSGGVPGLGPNFATNTIYVANTTQNAINIYAPSPGPSATPAYLIGGANTSLNGPTYMAFDSNKVLYVSNYSASTGAALLLAFQTYATGNVLPIGTLQLPTGSHPQGIGMMPANAGFALAITSPGGFFPNLVNVYTPFSLGSTFLSMTVAGSNTGLNNPVGVGFDKNKNMYVANSGAANVTVYALPSPTPSSSPTPTPAPTATPTAAPSGSPTATPAPTPTPSSVNIAPTTTISCACFKNPTGLALDSSNNLFVTDSGVPAVYVFTAAQIAPGGALTLTPSQSITGSNTKLVDPADVKVDSAGTIYVVDSGSGPNTSMLLIFPSTATGNVAPSTAISLPAGTSTGMALSP